MNTRVSRGLVFVQFAAVCLCCLAAVPPAFAAPQILPTTSSTATEVYASSTGRTDESGSYTAPAGRNRVLVLTTATYRAVSGAYNLAYVSTITLPTWNGITFTKSDGALLMIGTTNGLSAEQFYAAIGDSDSDQTATLSVFYQTNVDRKQAAITCLANIDQTNPLSATHYGANANSGTTTGTAAATGNLLNGPIPADYMVVDICANGASNYTLTPNASPVPVQTNVLTSISIVSRRYSTGLAYMSASGDKNMAYTVSGAARWNICATAYKSKYSVTPLAVLDDLVTSGGGTFRQGTGAGDPVWAGGSSNSYDNAAAVNIHAVPDVGHAFVRWEANVAALGAADNWVVVGTPSQLYTFNAGFINNDQATTLNRNGHVLRAVFTANPCTVTFDPTGGTVSPASTTVITGQTYGQGTGLGGVLPMPTRSGYSFLGWFDGAGGAGNEVLASTTVTITANQTLFAKWAATVNLTVTADAKTKVYDRNAGTDPVLTYTVNPALDPGDNLTGALTRAAGQNVGAYAITQGTLAVPAKTKYSIASFVSANLTITPKGLVVADAAALNKVYDGTTLATVTGSTLVGVVGGDVVTATAPPSGVFASKNVGNGIPVTAAGQWTLGGADAGNYTVTQPVGFTANITPKALTVSIMNNPTKYYDGTTVATLMPGNFDVSGLVGGETVTVTQTVGTYDSSAVGARTVTASLTGWFAAGSGTSLPNYSLPPTASGPGTIVSKQIPAVELWPVASGITFGQALSASALSGGNASVPGSFAYSAPATVPNAGTYSAAVTFTPNDTANYDAVTGNVSVTVNKAVPGVTWPVATPISFGQTLTASVLTGGAAVNPCSSAMVSGTFAFTVPATMPTSVGTHAASVVFTPTDTASYTTVSGSVDVTVNKATPTLTAPEASGIACGQALNASTLSGGAAVNPHSSAMVAGAFAFAVPSTVPTATGPQSVTFTPTDTVNYSSATTTVTVTVTGGCPWDDAYVQYNLDEGSGTLALDITGGGFNGILAGGVAYAGSSHSGPYCLSFNGVDGRVDVPRAVLEGKADRVIQMWVKAEGPCCLFRFDKWGGAFPGDYIRVLSNGTVLAHHYSSGDVSVTGTTPITDGQWHRVAFSVSSSQGAKLYVDEMLEASDSRNGSSAAVSSNNHCTLGCATNGNTPNNLEFLTGQIDDFRIDAGPYVPSTALLTVNSSGVSGVAVTSATGHGGTTNYTKTVASWASVSLTAAATAGGLAFTGWTGDATSSDQAISFSMSGDKTVVANYADLTPPVITLSGDAAITMECSEAYASDAGATASDDIDGDLSSSIVRTGLEPSSMPLDVGIYHILYDVSDAAHNAATQVTRVVTVSDTAKPVIVLNGDAAVTVECGGTYVEPGATATDACVGSIGVTTGGDAVNTSVPGVYTVRFNEIGRAHV